MKLITLVLACLLVACAAPEPKQLTAEQKAENKRQLLSAARMELFKLDGSGTANLADHLGNGKLTLVMIWDSTCGLTNFQDISAINSKTNKSRLEVVGISVDYAKSKEDYWKIKGHAVINKANFVNYHGGLEDISYRFQMLADEPLTGTPSHLLFDRKGNLAAKQVGVVDRKRLEQFINKPEFD